MISRFNTNIKLASGMLKGAESVSSSRALMRKYGIPRSLINELADDEVEYKPILSAPFIALVSALEGEIPSWFVNPSQIICPESLASLADGNDDDVAYVTIKSTQPDVNFDTHLAFHSNIDRIRKAKHSYDVNDCFETIVDYQVAIAERGEDDASKEQMAVELEFLGIQHPDFYRGDLNWVTNTPNIIGENEVEIRLFHKALKIDPSLSMPNQASPTPSLDDFIEESKKIQALTEAVPYDCRYNNFQIFYLAFLTKDETEIIWTLSEPAFSESGGDRPIGIRYEERRLLLSRKIARVNHALVVCPPNKKMVVLQCPNNGRRVIHLQSDMWEEPVLTSTSDELVEVHGVKTLFENCKDRVRSRKWLEDKKVDNIRG